MGGDHSVTLPELRACAKVNGPVALIHFDTTTPFTSTSASRTTTAPLLSRGEGGAGGHLKSIQVGIREGLYGPEDLTNSTDLGYQVLRADECHKMGMEAVLKAIRARVGSAKAFLTFDIDFLDPAYAPGTGTPVPGGFTTAQALELVRGLADLNIVGYDVVEVSPRMIPPALPPLPRRASCRSSSPTWPIKRKTAFSSNCLHSTSTLYILFSRKIHPGPADFSAGPGWILRRAESRRRSR